ncbi:hypothetical protein MNBD_NITROSPINAE02-1658 [hydrothermal vent metagenome]|uniref:Sulfatase N-terminal domain-containing protein n=1 Tax=hydrothermal vent metagenome TaxID=652676 RepID=A0A3B1CMQ6_9ZZZZ
MILLSQRPSRGGLLVTDIFLSLLYGAIAFASATLIYGSTGFFDVTSLAVAVIGFFWALIILVILDKSLFLVLEKIHFKTSLAVKSAFISISLYLLGCDLATIALTKSHISIYIIKTVFHENFREISGISDSTYYSGLVTFIVVPVILFFVVYKIGQAQRRRVSPFRHTFVILFLVVIMERGVTGYMDYARLDAIDKINSSIIWRPHVSARGLYKFVIDNDRYQGELAFARFNLEAAPLPESISIPVEHSAASLHALPDIVFIMVEGLRGDMPTPDIMPNISSVQGSLFASHYSTSNCTHFSMFSALFGLFPNHYASAIDHPVKPPLIDLADKLGYETIAFNSEDFNWWGMEKLISTKYLDNITLFLDGDWVDRDREMADRFKEIYGKREKPGFYYLTFNSTHHNYSYPDGPEYKKFAPTAEKNINLFSFDYESQAGLVFNRYKNSAYYVDHLVGDLIAHMKAEGGWDNTLFILFGDHGEEFYEGGRSLHANYLNLYQTSAAMLIHRPGDLKNEIVLNTTTSHMDILPTIIDVWKSHGVKVAQPDWMKGYSMFDGDAPKERVVYSALAAARSPSNFAVHRRKLVCYEYKDLKNESCAILFKDGVEGFIELQ